MKNFAPELIEKAKTAKTVEELLQIAQNEAVELTEEDAKVYFAQLNPTTGELSDDELDDVAGGACHGSSGGKKYTVVSSGLQCYNGLYRVGVEVNVSETIFHRKDNKGLRGTWALMSSLGCCGTCYYLEFDGTTGYCKYSLK